MKTALVITALVASTAGTVVLVTRAPGGSWSQEHTSRMRGSDAYYLESERQARVGPVSMRLNGDEDTYLKIAYVFTFRRGRELEDAQAQIDERMVYLLDALFMELPELGPERLVGREGRFELKRLLFDLTQEELFSEEEARVEHVWLDELVMQPVTHGQ